MMILKYILGLLLIVSIFPAHAQDTKHTLRAGLALGFIELGLDGNNPMAYFQYNYQLHRRIDFSGTFSFVNQSNEPRRSRPASLLTHVMGDVSVNFALIRSARHALKAGGGLTVRRRTELQPYSWSYSADRIPAQVAYYNYTRADDLGYAINVAYDFDLNKRTLLGARFAHYQYPQGGYFFFMGLNAGIKF